MNKFLILLAIILFTPFIGKGQNPPVVKFDAIERVLNSENDTLYILNFWATWCKPCVEELPYFEEALHDFENKKVRIILVSIDFKSHYESRLIPFIKTREIQNEVWLLDEPDYNKWIDLVSSDWSGAIPFTLMVRGGEGYRKSYEKTFTKEDLFSTILLNLN